MNSHLCSQTTRPKKLLIFNINDVLCYFQHSIIQQGNTQVIGRNIDMSKMEMKARVEHFLSKTFNYF
jgi:hypothetical protein